MLTGICRCGDGILPPNRSLCAPSVRGGGLAHWPPFLPELGGSAVNEVPHCLMRVTFLRPPVAGVAK